MTAAKLENRLPDDHPALLAALRAPIESETDEEREAVEAAMSSGQLVPGSMVTAEIARRARRTHG
jgi:adenylate kinase family enzyme